MKYNTFSYCIFLPVFDFPIPMPESASEIEDVVPDDVELSEESALDEDEDDVTEADEEVWMSLVKFGVASTPPPPRDDILD